ncbi:MAG: hypothetical protein ABIF82_10745 [Planctomycetota bacterium]
MITSYAQKTRVRNAGLSVIEILIIIICICAVVLFAGFFMRPISSPHGSARKARCKNNLKALGCAMHLYLNKFGDMAYFAEPANAFRGDEFFVTLFWTDIVQEPKVFVCPATADTGPVDTSGNPVPIPVIWNQAASLTDEQCSYAGRCKGLTGAFAHRNTNHAFTEAAMSSASAMACDKAHNHADGVNVVYFDTRVEFVPDGHLDVGVMHPTSAEPQLRYMDSGER